MPQCAAWVDEIRAVFGRASVDAALRAEGFYAAEAGHVIGAPSQGQAIGAPSQGQAIGGAALVTFSAAQREREAQIRSGK
jgi:hypothetical protein